jgi:molecular chaperone GrpE
MKNKKDQKTEELQKQILELTLNWKRALADYQNLEKRTNEEKLILGKFANALLIEKLLPVLDTLEKAATHTRDDGVTLALRQLKQVLADSGLREIETIRKPFDPNTSECIEVVKGDKEGIVTEVILTGYYLYDKVLRPAKVKVTKLEVNKEAKELAKEAASKGDYM